ncbi:Linear gramicidin synthase subunit A [Fundidesulfovibrio magnetotacticus]|uniref:phosphoribosylglycinamide formyltransferase 1 n=1 Tax=Fundidesulfovibrio magnetotacticus TaxID=2730080 RepID=A0A6V8M3A0_9BACT|nr:GNAT family N-acetyltransferase [Fundidesulfovibrio magnetotacticus]GFK94935.1 Linear gramicidin synthase subunit A [Fundidesulfovibrio magnetotacticus]
MNVLLLTGAPPSARIRAFLEPRVDRLAETSGPLSLEALRRDGVDLMVCHGYPHIIGPEVTRGYPGRIVNLHNTFLPWGRGMMGNVWSCFEDAPQGVSLHFIDEGVDSGALIARRLVDLSLDETLETSWKILMDALEDLFIEHWEAIAGGSCHATPQDALDELGSCHDRRRSETLLDLFPQRWSTPAAEVARLGEEYRRDPAAFARTRGADPYEGAGHTPFFPALLRERACPAQGPVTVREATGDDLLLNWLWINDPVTRRMFKQNGYVGWSGHCRWFAQMLANPDATLCIGLQNGKPIGNVRFNRCQGEAYEISINLAPNCRYKGVGAEMLARSIAHMRDTRAVRMLYAMAKKTNKASIRVFEKCGLPVVQRPAFHSGMARFEPDVEVYMEAVYP